MGRRSREKNFIKRKGKCNECDTTENLTLDHILAKSLGGRRSAIGNWQVLCEKCNSKKSAIESKKADEFYFMFGFKNRQSLASRSSDDLCNILNMMETRLESALQQRELSPISPCRRKALNKIINKSTKSINAIRKEMMSRVMKGLMSNAIT